MPLYRKEQDSVHKKKKRNWLVTFKNGPQRSPPIWTTSKNPHLWSLWAVIPFHYWIAWSQISGCIEEEMWVEGAPKIAWQLYFWKLPGNYIFAVFLLLLDGLFTHWQGHELIKVILSTCSKYNQRRLSEGLKFKLEFLLVLEQRHPRTKEL